MQITSLSIAHFRNLEPQTIEFTRQCTLICGANGQGKTSILEAVYAAACARSFRTTRLRETIGWEHKHAQVSLAVVTNDGSKEIFCEITPSKKTITVNGNSIERASAFYGQIGCIAFTPESKQLVQGAPGIRRRFIDRSQSMLHPAYVDTLVQYQRALRSRNSILHQIRASKGTNEEKSALRSQLDIWDDLLIQYGTQIIVERLQFLKRIEPIAQKYYETISGKKEYVRLRYASNILDKIGERTTQEENAALVSSTFRALLGERRQDDIARQGTSVGPHRDELEIGIGIADGKTQIARHTASQGQSRSIALALTLAEVALVTELRKESPMILLDDVESELDEARRQALFEVVSTFQSQAIITATEPSEALLKATNEPQILKVEAGKIINT